MSDDAETRILAEIFFKEKNVDIEFLYDVPIMCRMCGPKSCWIDINPTVISALKKLYNE